MPTTTRAGLLTSVMILFAATLAQAANLGTFTADGYVFNNFTLPDAGNAAGAGTNINGISNTGAAVGFSLNNNGNLSNFVRNPDGSTTQLNLNSTAMALGINSAGDVVGQQNGQAFLIPSGGSAQTLLPFAASAAFGINDQNDIVGQFTNVSGATPGFYLAGSNAPTFVQIDSPSGPNIVNAQGVNNNGLVVGFYIGNDGQFHGFDAKIQNAANGLIVGSAIADPSIPNVAGEPGATFVFSQILGVNDSGIAVGYYGDSTASEHGFFYNTTTGQYTFLDDPAEQFSNGVEVTQITGINNSGQISGFYSDGNGVFDGFVATPTPEPAGYLLIALGLCAIGLTRHLRRLPGDLKSYCNWASSTLANLCRVKPAPRCAARKLSPIGSQRSALESAPTAFA